MSLDPGIHTNLQRLLALRFAASRLNLFNRRLASSQLFGETRSRFRGRGMEFEEVRLYQPGDDIRAIDWRVTARTGKPHTKLFREERERPVHLLVDQRSSLYFGSALRFKSVLAAELAALVAWAALDNSDRIGGQVLGDQGQREVRARRNRHAVLQLLHDLVQANRALPSPSPTTLSLADALETCRRLTRPGTALFIISDFYDLDAAAEKSLHLLGRHADIRLVQVVDSLETDLPALGQVTLSDGQHRQRMAIDSAMARHFHEQATQRSDRLKRLASLTRAQLVSASTARDPLVTLGAVYGG